MNEIADMRARCPSAPAVLLALVSVAAQRQKRAFFIKPATICIMTGLNKDTDLAARAALEACGVIEQQRRGKRRKGGDVVRDSAGQIVRFLWVRLKWRYAMGHIRTVRKSKHSDTLSKERCASPSGAHSPVGGSPVPVAQMRALLFQRAQALCVLGHHGYSAHDLEKWTTWAKDADRAADLLDELLFSAACATPDFEAEWQAINRVWELEPWPKDLGERWTAALYSSFWLTCGRALLTAPVVSLNDKLPAFYAAMRRALPEIAGIEAAGNSR